MQGGRRPVQLQLRVPAGLRQPAQPHRAPLRQLYGTDNYISTPFIYSNLTRVKKNISKAASLETLYIYFPKVN